MTDQISRYVYLTGLILYFVFIYTPHMRRYRKKRIEAMRSRPFDIALDFVMFACWQVLPAVYVFAPWFDFANYSLPGWAWIIGSVTFAAAIVILFQAYATLGNNWSPKIEIQANQKLVTDGIYKYVRHPIYAGIWLWALSHPLLLHNWLIGFAMLACFIPLYFTRAPREEQMMLAQFGDEYKTYMSRTGGVIPKLGQ